MIIVNIPLDEFLKEREIKNLVKDGVNVRVDGNVITEWHRPINYTSTSIATGRAIESGKIYTGKLLVSNNHNRDSAYPEEHLYIAMSTRVDELLEYTGDSDLLIVTNIKVTNSNRIGTAITRYLSNGPFVGKGSRTVCVTTLDDLLLETTGSTDVSDIVSADPLFDSSIMIFSAAGVVYVKKKQCLVLNAMRGDFLNMDIRFT